MRKIHVFAMAAFATLDNLPQTFYLTITGNGDTDYTNVSMTKGENNLYAPTDGSKLLWATTNYDGVNISAYTADITQGFAVQTTQSSEANLEARDLLGATKNGTTDNGATIDGNGGINIAFNHLLVKLNIHFSFNKEYEALTMDKLSAISLNGVHTQGTYSEGVLTTAAATGDIKPFTAMDATAKTMTAESIFFPTLDGDSNLTLTVEVNSNQRYELKGTPVLYDIKDEKGVVTGKSFSMAFEDYIDSDYNDIYVNIVGWNNKG